MNGLDWGLVNLRPVAGRVPLCYQADLEIKQLIDDNSGDDAAVIYTDGSATLWVKSGWGFCARVKGSLIGEKSEAYLTTNSIMRVEGGSCNGCSEMVI